MQHTRAAVAAAGVLYCTCRGRRREEPAAAVARRVAVARDRVDFAGAGAITPQLVARILAGAPCDRVALKNAQIPRDIIERAWALQGENEVEFSETAYEYLIGIAPE